MYWRGNSKYSRHSYEPDIETNTEQRRSRFRLLSPGTKLYIKRLLRTRVARVALFLFAVVNFLEVFRIHSRIAEEHKHHVAPAHHKGERIYIAAMHFNDGALLRSHWLNAMLNLTEALGPENIFISIYESGSWDDTKMLLEWFDGELERRQVPHRIEMSDTTHQEEIKSEVRGVGWVDTPKGERALRRIPFLSKMRNKTIKDLVDLNSQGTHFDKVLFVNDVVFTVDDILTLLDTNGGDYAAACSLDFSLPPIYYDTFALRDSNGLPHATLRWPYFQSSESLNAMISNSDAVPVTSCWNGIVAMPSEPFVSSTQLRFRGVPDSLAAHHLEGSECCLIHADNPLSKTLGVYLNPRVRVGYNPQAYEITHPKTSWVSAWRIFWGLWTNRISRWATFTFDQAVVRRRVKRWEKEDMGNSEPGVFCLINEMHVIVENGWAHV